MQAIGRGRAALRSEDAPLEVYLFTNLPITDLPIDRLATLAELGAPGPRRRTPTAFYDRRDERNAEAAADNRARVTAALDDLRAEGVAVTWSEVARRSGVSRVTLANNATLHALVLQARRGGNERLTKGVNPSPDNDVDVSDQGFTPRVTDLGLVRPAIVAADRAADRGARRRATEELTARLADLARTRAHEPVPKPGAREARGRDIAQTDPVAG